AASGEYPSRSMAAFTRAESRTVRLPSTNRDTVIGETPANFATSCKVTRLLLRRFFLIEPVPGFFVIIASLQRWFDTAMVLLEHEQRSPARHSEDLVGMQSSFPAAKCYWAPLHQPRW